MATATILMPEQIPYSELTGDMFGDGASAQKIIPFLGAGVSTSAKATLDAEVEPLSRQDPRIADALERLSRPGSECSFEDGTARPTLDAVTKLYAEIALEMAFLIQRMRDTSRTTNETDLLYRLSDDPYPPSGSDLAEWVSWTVRAGPCDDLLTRVSSRLRHTLDETYRSSLLALLNSLADVAGVGPASLSSLCAFFEVVRRRDALLDHLAQILRNKHTPTPSHELLARAARWHLTMHRSRKGRPLDAATGHYLIMTTNYDCLMEDALQVPYVVLTLGLKDSLVRARFGNMPDDMAAAFAEANPPRTPRFFSLNHPPRGAAGIPAGEPQRLAIVYKVHGCITDWTDTSVRRDTIVISDNDYVTNISRLSDNDGVIPACVSDMLSSADRPYFLFMGYSLRDWNIRGMLRAVRTKRAGTGREDEDYGDYTVIRNVGRLEEAFFAKNDIRIIKEDLTLFSNSLNGKATERYGG